MREDKAVGRPREFDAGEALAKIMAVFWAQGFEGTSMSDLVAATGLKKGSLYAAFGDKRAMYLKALAVYDRTAIDGAVDTLTGTAAAAQRIAGFLQLAIDAVAVRKDRRGCFLCNASVDQAVLDSDTIDEGTDCRSSVVTATRSSWAVSQNRCTASSMSVSTAAASCRTGRC